MNPLELSMLASRIQAVCNQMGATLRRTAFSPNIKERLDFSCAVFAADGELCAQAAHIPVHLGSMAYAMRSLISGLDWAPGDMVIVNDPYLGGTHLPDVTLIAPLFLRAELSAFVANRAHHADIGCARPGSMPLSRSLAEEGLVIAPSKLLIAGQVNAALRARLLSGLRNPTSTMGDFQAQISANLVGLERLRSLANALPEGTLAGSFEALNAYAERLARATLAALPDGVCRAEDFMDDTDPDGTPVRIAASVSVAGDAVTIDFAGTSAQVQGNINCPLSVTAAAVYYVVYCLMPRETPACAGSLRPVTLRAEPGSLVNAERPAAVAAGNVETSQRIVDVLLAALAHLIPDQIPAASCGSMNNVAMGGRGWDYYETIGGGGGANGGSDGQDAVHTHMTNTLNTPIEVLEMNYPVRIRRYRVREGSGGAGRHRGGDGIVREYEFLDPASVTLLAERRQHCPWGMAGGAPGAVGHDLLNAAPLPGKVEIEVLAGDRLTIMTPGGGGWGRQIP